MGNFLPGVNSRAVRAVVILAALTASSTGCTNSASVPHPSETASGWDPETYLEEDARRQAEALGISNPPKVEIVRFILPSEDEIWVTCLNEAGYDFEPAPGGGFFWPKDQRAEIKEAMNLAVYVCTQKYPADPKYSAPETEERLKWMYRYRSTTLLDCLSEQGYPYTGTPLSEQAYIDSEGGWTPYADQAIADVFDSLVEKCPQTPPAYWEQPFW